MTMSKGLGAIQVGEWARFEHFSRQKSIFGREGRSLSLVDEHPTTAIAPVTSVDGRVQTCSGASIRCSDVFLNVPKHGVHKTLS